MDNNQHDGELMGLHNPANAAVCSMTAAEDI
jgi:hypothetical protein